MRDAMVAVPRDLRMLVLFDEIYRTQSMTRAAERLELSQPTASIWLAKLRREWRDPLFVRTSSGMQPWCQLPFPLSARSPVSAGIPIASWSR